MEDPGRFNRWLRFNGIGALGAGLQLAVLGGLTRLTPLHYLWATAVAVEATVLHNFCWHERWTWSDRRAASRRHVYQRLGYFQLTNGLISVAGNLVLMRVFAGMLGMDTLAANIVSIVKRWLHSKSFSSPSRGSRLNSTWKRPRSPTPRRKCSPAS